MGAFSVSPHNTFPLTLHKGSIKGIAATTGFLLLIGGQFWKLGLVHNKWVLVYICIHLHVPEEQAVSRDHLSKDDCYLIIKA